LAHAHRLWLRFSAEAMPISREVSAKCKVSARV
jgi:hypothetical protein